MAAARAEAVCPEGDADFPSFYSETALFTDALARVEDYPPSPSRVTGIAVPHHLLVGHLTALGFKAASGFRPKRIVVLSPDHFRRTAKPFAVTMRGFDTVLGPVPGDPVAARALEKASALVEESCLFSAEHGVQAMLPFIRHYFAGVPVLAVAVSVRSTRSDWEEMAQDLGAFVDSETLVVQSTDFSHFLPQAEARRVDQQVLNVLAAGDLDAIAALHQPDHVDSLGAFFIQAALQRKLAAQATVIANENSQKYSESIVGRTTSYLVALWGPRPGAPAPGPDATRIFLAGDTNFGRAMKTALNEDGAADRIEQAVLSVTHGAPLVVNLEGVILPNVPAAIDDMTLAMPGELAIPWLKRLNVQAVSLANNHALDLNASGLAETRAALDQAGIASASQGEVLRFPGLDIVCLSDLDTNASAQIDLLTPALLDRLGREGPDRAVAAFVHWGREWITRPSAREEFLLSEMERRAVPLVAGAHPHRASDGLDLRAGGDMAVAYSLGNFLFDQTDARGASGALLELTVFSQGTIFARVVPIPNLFELAGG